MKDRHLRVRPSCCKRGFYLFKPKGIAAWHIKFMPPRWSFWRAKLGNGIVYRSTGTSEVAPAKDIAERIINSFWKTDSDGSVDRVDVAVRTELATIQEIFERYRTGARFVTDKEELADSTINGNVNSLVRIIETRFDEAKPRWTVRRLNGLASRSSVSVLTGKLFEDFKMGWLASVDRENLQSMASAKQTVNGYIRQARSIFAKEYMPLYKDLILPDLSEIRDVRSFKVKGGTTRYVPIPQATIDVMETEIRALRDTRPDLYLAFYMMLWLGMRVGEVRNVRLEWIEEYPDNAQMAIVRRPYWKPKGIDGFVPIAPTLLADIKELSGARAPMDFLLPLPNDTARHNALRQDLSAIIRRHLGASRRKTCHELRKHAISMVLMRTRSYPHTLQFSRHSEIRTLRKHYEGFLDQLAPITSSNWRDERVA